MPGLVVQHNLSAINANNKMNTNVTGLKKATEKLSSGYQINRAGDNAAGLAISEKMRSQIRGLAQATKNANDGISLIQTAEGGLNETHAILQRMRELAVQSANGTYTQEDRDAIQLEAEALKSEIDRISEATEYNTMKLLDGSLATGGNSGDYGPLYGSTSSGDVTKALTPGDIYITGNIKGASITITNGASGVGGENALWDEDGKNLTINLAKGHSYTDAEIQKLIDEATQSKGDGQGNPPGKLTFKSEYGIISGPTADDASVKLNSTESGVRQTFGAKDDKNLESLVANGSTGGIGSSDNIIFTANTYGKQTDKTSSQASKITILTDVGKGKEWAEAVDSEESGKAQEVTLHLSTGVKYSEKDIENLLKTAGFDYTVTLTDDHDPDGANDGYVYFNVAATEDNGKGIVFDDGTEGTATYLEGAGLGKDFVEGIGKGLTFQIGANGVEDQRVTLSVDDMGADALGVAGVDVSTQDSANKAIDQLDAAIGKVSMQRAGLGALQNRLEYTVNNLTTTEENLTNAESQIRDTDMATEMINYTKFNILQQASQAMLAQANQQPQAVLQLLG